MGQTHRLIQIDVLEQGLQRLGVAVVVPVIGDRGLTHRLDAVVKRLPALALDDLAEHRAQEADFVTQGLVGGGGGRHGVS